MKALIDKYKGDNRVPNVNAHVHTPYSFSSFDNIEQIFQMAANESVDVVGINDFYTTKGHQQFFQLSSQYKKYPLFNIEFIGLIEDFQQRGIRVNDPNNPGRMYFCGKGLRYPFTVSPENRLLLDSLIEESHLQVQKMTENAARLLAAINKDIVLTFSWLKDNYATYLVRERHLAKAIKDLVLQHFKGPQNQKAAFDQLFEGKALCPILMILLPLKTRFAPNC
ncbi:MAG: hypothetical protein HC896_17520 [Bacteroidales bacterium]|nr:hypothetical protein [Bacteroidales bacterium]